MFVSRWAAAVLLGCAGAALTTSLAGCAPDDDGRVHVVTAVYPLQYVAQRVVGDETSHVRIRDLTQPGVEPHDIQLTVRQTADVADADVLFYERGLQPDLDDAVDTSQPHTVVDAAHSARLRPFQDGSHGTDPHFWLDPTRLSAVAGAFERGLASADPARSHVYRANLLRLQGQLAALDRAYRRGLADCRIRTIVASHDAFGYLGRRYGFTVVGINGLSPDAEPSPAHIRQLQQLIRAKGITTVFSERLQSRRLADSLAGDLGLHTAVLDPIEGLTRATADQDYLTLMRTNLRTLTRAEQCS